MIYVYDRIVSRGQTEFEYLEETYKLQAKNKMGKFEYYSYSRPGSDMILVIPEFAQEFLEAAKIFVRIQRASKGSAVEMRIKERFKTVPNVDNYGTEENPVYHYEVSYKNIRITMVLSDGHLALSPDFTIVTGNVFGEYISVDVRDNEELYKYCEEV